MSQKPTNYYRPDNLEEALRLLAQPDTFPLAGGTKLLAGDVSGAVVDLQNLGLNRIDLTAGELHAGATVTLAALAESLPDGGPADWLRRLIHRAGPNTVRNAATLGGTIAARQPDSELLAGLLALAAALTFDGSGVSSMSLADYLAAGERPSRLITAITIPWQPGQGRSERVARTPADYPIVSVTMWQPQEGSPRLAATGIGGRPCRLYDAESHLKKGINDKTIQAAAQAAQAACRHPGDFRGSAAYRAEMTAVLTRRVCK